MRILLIEDEQRLAEALKYVLEKNKFLVDMTDDGMTGQDMAESGIYDVIVLDRMLPGKEGVEILRYLRHRKIKTPVIFITAKDAVANRIEGLDAGADDYLVKPFSNDELLARVRALGRRSENLLIDDKVSVASLHLDIRLCEASTPDGTIKLSVKEAQLLALFMHHAKQVLTKEQILDRVWGFEKDVDISNVELYVFYLRKKINLETCGVSIHTVRGVGYCLPGRWPIVRL